METATITITIRVDSSGVAPVHLATSGLQAEPEATLVKDEGAPAEQRPEYAKALRVAVRRLNGPVSRRFLREVAEKSLRGEVLTVDQELGQRYGFADGGSLGGAIGAAATQLAKATGGRWVLDRVSQFPSVWKMLAVDARVVLAALDEGVSLRED